MLGWKAGAMAIGMASLPLSAFSETISCPSNLYGAYIKDPGNPEQRYLPESYFGPAPRIFVIWDLSTASKPRIPLKAHCEHRSEETIMEIPLRFKECRYSGKVGEQEGTFTCSDNPPNIPATGGVGELNPTNDKAVAAFANIIALLDQGKFPQWYGDDFAKGMQPYLSKSLISAVRQGDRIASGKDYDLWDGELITGSQGLERVKLWTVKIVERSEDAAILDVGLSTLDTPAAPNRIDEPNKRYWMKKEDGLWKLDDIRDLGRRVKPTDPNLKALFQNPDKYLGGKAP